MMPWFWFFTPMINVGLVQINGVDGGTVNVGLGQEIAAPSTNRSDALQVVVGDQPIGWVHGSLLLTAMASLARMQAAAPAAMPQPPATKGTQGMRR